MSTTPSSIKAIIAREMQHPSHVWYFAYGSNLSLDKLTGGRGIHPSESARVLIPGWRLTTEIGGLPYQEPAFSSISPIDPSCQRKQLEVVGVAYRVTFEDWISIVGSEGGGTAYTSLSLRALPISDKDATITGGRLVVETFGTAFRREPEGCPSKRYMDIIINGASFHRLPDTYLKYLRSIETYQPPEKGLCKAGAAIFIAMWGPVMAFAEAVTKMTVSKRSGMVPPTTIMLVRLILVAMWFVHDYLFAPLIGRGDGLDQDEQASV